jgi:hypothetical protein
VSGALDWLADALRADPLAFTILVGAGVSRPAGLATGQDLLALLAAGRGEASAGSLVDWYVRTFGGWPSYEAIACAQGSADGRTSPAELFEPTRAERAAGVKVPQAAHQALARLASAGYIRLFVTTNFDRLIETALADAGVPARVVAPATGVDPLVLPPDRVTVVKLHGDWATMRPKVLARRQTAYSDRRIVTMIGDIVAQYHMIVCGWSGEWDVALRCALADGPSHRRMFWAAIDEPGAAAAIVISARRAEVIRIEGADRLFADLADRLLDAVPAGEATAAGQWTAAEPRVTPRPG